MNSKFSLQKMDKKRKRAHEYYQANKEAINEAKRKRRKLKPMSEVEKEKNRARAAAWQEANKERAALRKKVWCEANKEMLSNRTREWKKQNPDMLLANLAKRKASKAERTPPWLTDEHIKEIRAMYKKAFELTKGTGVKHHVDHIVALRGKTVSGLHVPWNLQVITAQENLAKRNKLLLTIDFDGANGVLTIA